MRYRVGFVSNSSSSSFMIAGTKDQIHSGIISITIRLERLIDGVFDSEEKLAKYFQSNYGKGWRDDDEYLIEKYDAAVRAIKAGKVVAVGGVSNEQDGIEPALYESPELFNNAVVASGFELIEEIST